MTAAYQAITEWRIPRSVVHATLRGVLRGADAGHESGAFWLGRRAATSTIQTVVLLEPPGVVEESGYWEVSALLSARVATWADGHAQVLLGVAHSHLGRGATWMSPLDCRGAVHVPDVLTIVIPAIDAVPDLRAWGIHRFDGATFVELTGSERRSAFVENDDDLTVLRATEEGIHDD